MMSESRPSFALEGVPLNVPFELLKLAQTGLFRILNFSVLAPNSEVVGVKVYLCVATTLEGGWPEIVNVAASAAWTNGVSAISAIARRTSRPADRHAIRRS
jgi:hypothetical protein